MKLHRRDFTRLSALFLASLAARPLWAEGEPQGEPPTDSAASATPAPRVIHTWGTNGHGEGQFDIPIAIVINRKDEILVTDFRQTNAEAKARLQRFDAEGHFLGAFEMEPMPGGLALDAEGLLYATHMMRHKVVVYDSAGKQVREFGKLGTAPGEFNQPGGIAFGPDGNLYVADQVNHRVQRLTPQGEPIGEWGKYGVATGEFGGSTKVYSRVGGPHFLAFDRHGHIYTTEGSEGRVQRFKPDGTFLAAWGDNELGPGHFGGYKAMPGPIAIAINAKDEVWVTSTNNLVQQFTLEGRYIRGLKGEGSEPGQFKLPHGLAFDSHGFLYVADARNSRIQKIAV